MLLVLQQFKGLWNINNANLRSLCNEALQLRGDFHSYTIQHIRRVNNLSMNSVDMHL